MCGRVASCDAPQKLILKCLAMNEVRIKSLPRKRPERDKLLSSLASFGIKCFKLQELKSDLFQVWCNFDSDVDLLFSDGCVKELKKNSLRTSTAT